MVRATGKHITQLMDIVGGGIYETRHHSSFRPAPSHGFCHDAHSKKYWLDASLWFVGRHARGKSGLGSTAPRTPWNAFMPHEPWPLRSDLELSKR
jgi:hypothetical protein